MVAKSWSDVGELPVASDAPGHDDSDPELIALRDPFAPRSPEEQYLRNRSSYLAPDGMSKVYLGLRIVLGLLVNVAFLALPVFGLTVLLAEFFYRPHLPRLVTCGGSCAVVLPRAWWIVPLALVAASLVCGLVALLARIRRDWLQRGLEVWATRLALAALVAAFFGVVLPELVLLIAKASHALGVSEGAQLPASAAGPSAGAGSVGAEVAQPQPGAGGALGAVGLAGLLAGVAASLRKAFATPKDAVDEIGAWAAAIRKLSAGMRTGLTYLGAAIAGPLLVIGVMVGAVSLALEHSEPHAVNWWYVVGAGAALGAFGLFYAFADLTTWSLHPFYRRRLCSAFALKRVTETDRDGVQAGEAAARSRQMDREEGRAVAVERRYDELVPLSDTALSGGEWPTLIVCAAANVSDPGATPPGRRITSFTFSANAIGGPLVGAAPTKVYEQAIGVSGRRGRDLTLPAAVAMSGAALSPSMGKQTRRALTFLLALANVRLGVWIPNPRWVQTGGAAGRRIFYGRPRPGYLLRELLGRNRVDGKYLYVTDGGHYENLGLVELLRRGCTEIYCFDASNGTPMGQLGDAIALARSELGVEIGIDPRPLLPDAKTQVATTDAVRGTIRYANGATGTLIYAANVMTAQAPWDVQAHHAEDARFPHDSTADQLYTDQKFESYRVLGERAAHRAVALMRRTHPRSRAAIEAMARGTTNGDRRPRAAGEAPAISRRQGD